MYSAESTCREGTTTTTTQKGNKTTTSSSKNWYLTSEPTYRCRSLESGEDVPLENCAGITLPETGWVPYAG